MSLAFIDDIQQQKFQKKKTVRTKRRRDCANENVLPFLEQPGSSTGFASFRNHTAYQRKFNSLDDVSSASERQYQKLIVSIEKQVTDSQIESWK
jgi:hypothetical protein